MCNASLTYQTHYSNARLYNYMLLHHRSAFVVRLDDGVLSKPFQPSSVHYPPVSVVYLSPLEDRQHISESQQLQHKSNKMLSGLCPFILKAINGWYVVRWWLAKVVDPVTKSYLALIHRMFSTFRILHNNHLLANIIGIISYIIKVDN